MQKLLAAFLLLRVTTALGEDLLDDLMFYDVNLMNEIEMGQITPANVEGFEILYASPGAGDISEIAGHLLLRVKLNNNPRATEAGIENPNDLVISILADTQADKPERRLRPIVVQPECKKNNWFNIVANNGKDEPALESIWQSLLGLSGGFFMTMDRQTLGHAIKSYSIEQDRDLLRYKLNLTPKQKAGLIKRLYAFKADTKPRYFFFSQNCGSVLIRIIAEGINDKDNAAFSPLIAPPHTLLGNLIRSGVASRITPAFYSYRKKGFIARELFSDFFHELQIENPDLPWPSLEKLNHANDSIRAATIVQLRNIVDMHAQLNTRIYQLASLVQEKEMIYEHKDLICENYTSSSTFEARKLQAHILKNSSFNNPVSNTDKLLNDYFDATESLYAKRGSAHTELYRFAFGVGHIHYNDLSDKTVFALAGSLLKQDMGSRSRIAMQRSSAVTLGGFSANISDDSIDNWKITGLKLRKFRDTLNNVPSIWESARSLGLGLTVLDIDHSDLEGTRTVIGGIECLGNLLSSANYNDFLLLSAGVDFSYDDGYEIGIPIGFEHLWSFDKEMNRQWRNHLIYDPVSNDRLRVSSSLVILLGELFHADWLIRFAAEYLKTGASTESGDTLVTKFQLEINRW